VGLVAALVLTGCGTGRDAATQQVYDPGAGVNDRSSDVYVLNAVIVGNGEGRGTLSVSLLDKFGDGDELVQVEATNGAGQPIKVRQAIQPLPICTNRLTVLGPDGAVTFRGDFTDGETVDLALIFADAEPVRMQVPVWDRGSGWYDSIAETPAADASAQPCSEPSPSPTATASG